MSERSTFVRYVLTGALTLAGLLFPSTTASAATHGATVRFHGRAFDTCQAPSLATMRAWRAHSSYRGIGIYYGGRARACRPQVHLTRHWVARTTATGWHLLPIYVGSQAPCVTGLHKTRYRIATRAPSSQGKREGADAVRAARALGFAPGSPLYLDMEAYRSHKHSCAAATLKFVRAWTRQVHAHGYLAGFYSSADSGVRQMEAARRAGVRGLPDVMWYARWGVRPTLTRERVLRARAWSPHARIHQYAGSVTESHGGRRLTIDRDLVDAPVAVVR
jgi:hypothetical protein